MFERPTHEQLLAGDVYVTSIINEPVTVKEPKRRETALERARRLWFTERQS